MEDAVLKDGDVKTRKLESLGRELIHLQAIAETMRTM